MKFSKRFKYFQTIIFYHLFQILFLVILYIIFSKTANKFLDNLPFLFKIMSDAFANLDSLKIF